MEVEIVNSDSAVRVDRCNKLHITIDEETQFGQSLNVYKAVVRSFGFDALHVVIIAIIVSVGVISKGGSGGADTI